MSVHYIARSFHGDLVLAVPDPRPPFSPAWIVVSVPVDDDAGRARGLRFLARTCDRRGVEFDPSAVRTSRQKTNDFASLTRLFKPDAH